MKKYFFIPAMCIFIMLSAIGQINPKDNFQTACGGHPEPPITKVWDGSYSPWTRGSGTQDDPFQITEPEHLAYLAYLVKNGEGAGTDNVVLRDIHFKLMINIDLNDIEWTPIGYRVIDSYHYFFGGHFDGIGYTVSGLFVSSKDEWLGLFGGIKDGSVTCLKVIGKIERKDPPAPALVPPPPLPPPPPPPPPRLDPYAGGIVGYAENTVIQHCYSEVSIYLENTDPTYIGGIAGASVGTTGGIFFGANTGNITAFSAWRTIYLGGIVGYTTTPVRNSYNTGNIVSVFDESAAISCRGGIAGYSSADIIDCYNMGNIFGVCDIRRFNGGIVAAAQDNTVRNCYNAGTVSDTQGGAIAGKRYNNNVTVSNCYYLNTSGGNNSLGGTSKTADFMKTTEMIELLGSAFWQDYAPDYFNQGYPILLYNVQTTGITDRTSLNRKITVYPNPTNGQLTIISSLDNKQLANNYSIYNIAGQNVMQGVREGETMTINVESLAKGIYYLKIMDETVTFIKE